MTTQRGILGLVGICVLIVLLSAAGLASVVLTHLDLSPIHRHKLRPHQVIARGAVLRHQLSLTSAEGQAGKSHCRAATRCRRPGC